MGKGKRIRGEKSGPLTTSRATMKTLLVSTINSMDDDSYQGFCNIVFTAFGITDGDGNITEEWGNSPFWEVKGRELRPAVLPVKGGEAIEKIPETIDGGKREQD